MSIMPTRGFGIFLLTLSSSFAAITGAQAQEPVGEAGKISRNLWTGISGLQVSDLLSKDKYFTSSGVADQLSLLEAPSNIGDNYGQRLRGYVIAPLSGEYRFILSGDNQCALWLGESADKFSKRKLIDFREWTSPRELGAYRSQQSDPVMLTAGQRYFIEVLHKESGGDDNLAVSWSYAGGSGLVNWALDSSAIASQSATAWGGAASRAIDGNTNRVYNHGSISHTDGSPGNWWQVDLGSERPIDRVELFNRDGDGAEMAKRLSNFRISILDALGNEVHGQDFHTAGSSVRSWERLEAAGVRGRFVKIANIGPSATGGYALTLAEVKVLGRADDTAAFQPFEIVPGSVLQSYAGSLNDADNDEYPDDWEIANGFDPTKYQDGQYAPNADPDGDGLRHDYRVRSRHPAPSSYFIPRLPRFREMDKNI